ncbi:uncharacterized protein LOC106169229 isoform X2 [Lingula anatina]|uniref:Uncharacterized protein LOC106169229 isoform X2 n=1 Tax=Lingula anatina TaxID=7574 RepID=A0A1S3J104_LINAN|nr:uncharacterized protein LOC106169229 isoform X2 [Lingula anatina]XP_013404129.1 uncharacterized protein LOC106169229 isoform X2 [Lingula anatina]|eukprot:XP_013404122.1 uncharacterized protein LOC106169229 isoform X2 [Lingula anatina]
MSSNATEQRSVRFCEDDEDGDDDVFIDDDDDELPEIVTPETPSVAAPVVGSADVVDAVTADVSTKDVIDDANGMDIEKGGDKEKRHHPRNQRSHHHHGNHHHHSNHHGRRMSMGQQVQRHFQHVTRESCEMHCCRIHILLTTMQLCLGSTIIGLGAFMGVAIPSLHTRETPYWAGIPLFLAGVFGAIFFCVAENRYYYSGSCKLFVIKAVVFTLSAISVFVCIVASIFPGIHGRRIAQYTGDCVRTNEICYCHLGDDNGMVRVYAYPHLLDCRPETFTSIKDNLILQCALNAIGCGVSIWLVVLLWQSRYQNYPSGLRFYSYSANSHHPWMETTNRPAYSTPVDTPSFDRKLSQKRLLARQQKDEEEEEQKRKCIANGQHPSDTYKSDQADQQTALLAKNERSADDEVVIH